MLGGSEIPGVGRGRVVELFERHGEGSEGGFCEAGDKDTPVFILALAVDSCGRPVLTVRWMARLFGAESAPESAMKSAFENLLVCQRLRDDLSWRWA